MGHFGSDAPSGKAMGSKIRCRQARQTIQLHDHKMISQAQFDAMQARVRLAKHATALAKDPTPNVNAEVREIPLHFRIIAWADSQWPRVKYIHARTDKRSTIDVGAPDFILFLPGGRVLLVECKNRDGKLTPEQAAWHAEAARLGHQIHVVRSMDDFLAAVG